VIPETRCTRHRRERLLKKPETVAAIILAAGGSARFGTPKQLLTQQGENLVHRAARSAFEAGIDHVIVILGAYASTVESFLSDFSELTVAINDNWQTGQASSLRLGIEHARRAQCDAAVVMLADQPMIGAQSIRMLIHRFDDEHHIIASEYNSTIGAPALFGAEYFDQLLDLTGDHGAGIWLRSNRHAVTSVRMEEASIDIDTPDDLKHLPQN
jgi:CTP:molybdopterin cytidylyltransferase MocA